LFKTQIAAILQAGALGNVWMMFPMITNKTEIIKAKQFVEEVKTELRRQGKKYNANTKIGIMIETPAAAFEARTLAKEVDFFSLGTNDLSQYLFAADRSNVKLTELNSHFQPTLLRVIYSVVKAAHEANIEVDICGQAAEIVNLTPLWVAMGIDNLSVSIPKITTIRRSICSLYKTECEKLLDSILKMETVAEVERELKDFAKKEDVL
jgi:phosphotransferase system enzyme I (PtsI)